MVIFEGYAADRCIERRSIYANSLGFKNLMKRNNLNYVR